MLGAEADKGGETEGWLGRSVGFCSARQRREASWGDWAISNVRMCA